MKKNLLFAGLMMACLGAFTSCTEHSYPNQEAPAVNYAPNTLSGYITDIDGKPLEGATVTYGDNTTKTDANGYYIFNDIKAGEYKVTASAENYFGASEQITVQDVEQSLYVTWNAILDRKVSKTVNVTVEEGGEGEVTSEAIQGNNKANIDINIDIDAGTVPDDVNLYITPIYTSDSDVISRADSEDLLIGATLSCDHSDIVLNKPINIHFDVDNTVTTNVTTKILENGKWVDVPFTTDATGVNIETTKLTSVGLFFPVTLTKTTTTASIAMTPDTWDNLFGYAPMHADSSKLSFRTGADFKVNGANSLEALLIERLARLMGPMYKTVNTTYPIDLDLPAGTAARATARQYNTIYTLTSTTHSVKGTLYGTVEVTVTTTTTTDHEGGSN